uniref:Activin_recp domain-containing protein n=1 Tax=Steinernema glaseri TaxID=37863 RepID=A0A1I7XYY8_9BILA
MNLLFVALQFAFIALADCARCFCDKERCGNAVTCTGERCKIGFRLVGETVRMEQLCSNEPEEHPNQCHQDHDSWQEVCTCTEDFCNTFIFLRSSLDRMRNDESKQEIEDAYLPHTIRPHREDMSPNHSRNLSVLFVIVPVTVGGLATCLIVINYHCKM